MFQKQVNRQLTVGFPGTVVRDGTLRAKPGQIVSPTVQANGSSNRIGRVFGYVSEDGTPNDAQITAGNTATPSIQTARAGIVADVEVGGTSFFGILFHPQHYASVGSSAGALAPTLDLPQYTEGEFLDSTAGVVVEVFSGDSATDINFNNKLAYVPKGISSANNPLKYPLGAIITYTGDTVPTGMTAIPNAKVISEVKGLAASSADALISTSVIVQLAN